MYVNHFLRIGHCGSLAVHLLSGLMAGINIITAINLYWNSFIVNLNYRASVLMAIMKTSFLSFSVNCSLPGDFGFDPLGLGMC